MWSPITPVRLGIVLSLAVAVGYAWYVSHGRWRTVLSERFLYGVPWGTLVTVAGVVSFYLFAQSGFQHWNEPVVIAFRSWSYFYPVGILTAGFAHGGPSHLIGNMAGTLVLGPIAEYFWGHYPPARLADNRTRDLTRFTAGRGRLGTALTRPWVRALVVFPLVIAVVSLVTSAFAFGWSLGFSGTVFAIGGFALVRYPLTTIVSMLAITGVNVLISSLLEPVLRATSQQGPPGPPSWAVVNVQAHMLGFLVGVLVGVALLGKRQTRPAAGRIFVGVLLFVLARQLWAFAYPAGDDVFFQFRGVGLIFVFLLTVLVTAAVTARDRPVPRSLSVLPVAPSRRHVGAGWLVVVVSGAAALGVATAISDESVTSILGPLVTATIVLALPAIVVLLPGTMRPDPLTRRHVAIIALATLTIVVALPSVVSNVPVVDDTEALGEKGVTVDDYHITYADNVTDGRISGVRALPLDNWGTSSGVVVVSEQRHIWSTAVPNNVLSHERNSSVVVGGLGWRESVDAERTGWKTVGGETAYVVDLTVGNDTTRSFVSEAASAEALVDGHTVSVVPTDGSFRVNVTREGQQVGSDKLPATNESTTVGALRLVTESDDRLFAESGETRVLIAEKEG